MTLIKSISGIRGTIGGSCGDNLTPLDIVNFTSGYARLMQETLNKQNLKIIVGRDARVSGDMVNKLVCGALMGMGIDVVDVDLSTTPTVEMTVIQQRADGGIILTASHNPKQWNALKLLNEKGEFLDANQGSKVLEYAEKKDFKYSEINGLGTYSRYDNAIDDHIESILSLPLVDVEAIKKANLKIVIDCVNSTGGIALPKLLKKLGVEDVIELYCEPNGLFPHNPEPLPEHLTEISSEVVKNKADLGFVVDPDVDRLAMVCENGEMFGEEYTLVSIADYILSHNQGNTVSNLSSSMALKDITLNHNGQYFASAVGEVNVVELMKKENAVIGGEGNGGIIYPELHYGRDSLVGIALFLTHFVKKAISCSELRASYPYYYIAKNKIQLSPNVNLEETMERIAKKYCDYETTTIDGLKIYIDSEWVHLRKSNTEPIIRIYAESSSEEKANSLAEKMMKMIEESVVEC